MKTLLTAAVLALVLSACAGTSGGTQAYGEIKGGVETSHIRSGR
ncbi:Uncharacterised protein [Neisseria animaloris]|uniref:Lipoprotein n=1 Tax=Neisseria animaloris TaxID=326522 RepID=A0A3S4ZDX4_9NEIS|nr:hypothetical protein [Neisseria animaloris]MDO5073293.1 hypothetical protein [Neisseria animaloris]VEH87559.1 Uncharacterised protein [Neisseria animaloris]VEJ22340.1 Uncharacterised protein [Neisseria animaloris]